MLKRIRWLATGDPGSFFLSFFLLATGAVLLLARKKQTEGKISATPVLQADQRETAEAFLKTLDNLRCYQ